MRSEVTLGAAVRENLLSLKKTTALANTASARISTGLKVRSASDDAVAYFQAKALSDRSRDFMDVKEGIEQGVGSLNAALNGTDTIEALANQLKGIVLSAAGKSASELAELATQFDELRSQITNVALDTFYQGVSLVSSARSMTVDLAPAGAASVAVAGKDLRTSNQVTTEDIRAVWQDSSSGTSLLATRTFSAALSATTDESISSVALNGGIVPVQAARMLDGGTAIAYRPSGSSASVNLRLLGPDGTEICTDISVSTTSAPGSNFDVSVLNDGRIAVAVGGAARVCRTCRFTTPTAA